MNNIIHLCPPHGAAVTPCCGRTPFELLRVDRMTHDPALVTCGKPAHSRLPFRAECFAIYNADGEQIAHTGGELPATRAHESEANAALLAHCATVHPRLIAVLREVADACAVHRQAIERWVGTSFQISRHLDSGVLTWACLWCQKTK